MELKPIRTKKDYQAALAEVEHLWDAPAKSPEADRLEVLTLLIEHYERRHFPITDPDPIEFLAHVMESRGMTRKDLEPYIGPRGRVSDILNRIRPLTLEMIRKLSKEMKLPAEVLIRHYPLRRDLDKELAAA
jgi:HTH-type transcriptional regulator/antitoxin HigA